jgi:hypothetical protein
MNQAVERVHMPISEDRKNFIKFQMQNALEIVKADLEKGDATLFPEIQAVVTNLGNIELDWQLDSPADLEKVNTLFRKPLLDFLVSGVLITPGKNVHYYVYKSLLLLSAYWPLNEYRLDSQSENKVFICPLDHKPIDSKNRMLLSTGSQINLEKLPVVDTKNYALIEIDPCSRKNLNTFDRINLGKILFASSEYTLHKAWQRSKNMLWGALNPNIILTLIVSLFCMLNFKGSGMAADILMFITFMTGLVSLGLLVQAFFTTNRFYKNAETQLLESDEKILFQMGLINELFATLALIDNRAAAPETFTLTIGSTSPPSASSKRLRPKPKKSSPPTKSIKPLTSDEKNATQSAAMIPELSYAYCIVSTTYVSLKTQLTRLEDTVAELRDNFIVLRNTEFKYQFSIRSDVLELGGAIDDIDALLATLSGNLKNLKESIEENKDKNNLAFVKTQLNKFPDEIMKHFTTVQLLEEKIKKETLQAQHSAAQLAPAKKTLDVLDKLAEKERQRKAREDFFEQEKLRLLEEKKLKSSRRNSLSPATSPLTPSMRAKHIRTSSSHQTENEIKTPPPIDRRILRGNWMSQACQNIMHIKWILEEDGQEKDWQVKEFALLYNIFNCFQALKMYQHFFGAAIPEFDADVIINLRNMMLHHGSAAVSNPNLLSFAEQIKNKLPLTLLNLNKKYLIESQLTDAQRNDLITAFGLKDGPEMERMHYASIFAPVIADTPFYKELAGYNEAKIDNNLDPKEFANIMKIYVPLMKSIAFSFKVPVGLTVLNNEFLPTYLFQIQALYMLTTLCGEIKRLLPRTGDSAFNEFLNFCLRVRNEVGHELIDVSKYSNFVCQLQAKLSHLKNEEIFIDIPDNTDEKPAANARRFFAATYSPRTTEATAPRPDVGWR